MDCEAEVPDLLSSGEGRRGEGETGGRIVAHALSGDDAECFTVDCVASSEGFVEHARECDLLVTLPAHVRERVSK